MKINLKRYFLYLVRWQLSTPILAWCVVVFAALGATWATVIANLIGGLIFYFLDFYIFNQTNLFKGELWETQIDIICSECSQKIKRGYRLVKTKGYDKMSDKKPEFRCKRCSKIKYKKTINKS